MPKSVTLSADEVLAMIRDAVTKAGGQRAAARRFGVSAAYINDLVHARREPGDAILRALGLTKRVTRTVVYERIRTTPEAACLTA